MSGRTNLRTALLAGIVALAKPALAEPPCAYAGNWTAMRPQTSQLARLVDIGMAQSATLRQLIQDVEARCGVVFIQGMDLALARRKALGMTLHRVMAVGSFRYMYVVVDTRPGVPEVLGTIGHELQHVRELLDSGATEPADIDLLFSRIGMRVGHGVFETAKAEEMGAQVRREIQGSNYASAK